MRKVQTTCPYCGVGCGIVATVDAAGAVEIAGDRTHPANSGRLCSKGAALGETVDLEGRLLFPQVGRRQVGWDEALQVVASTFGRVVAEHGPDAVAFYISGQLLTEDYYVVNKFAKGFLGTANVDTNSRLCMASAVAAHKRAFGSDTVPVCYEDLERAKLIVLVGANSAWCHPVLFQRIVQARRDHPDLQVVVIDPRRTATCDIADQHLPLRPGSDAMLFNGLLHYIAQNDEVNHAFVEQCTEGFDEALQAARRSAPTIAQVAEHCQLAADEVARFYRLFARTERVVTVFSQGINQSTSGSDKGNAIINCHLATGRIGRPGAGPFSVTGQPNAMGGREVGGLANQLAAHMELERPDHRRRVQAFWGSPTIAQRPGLKAVELFKAVAAGRVKALWIMGTNPAVSLPDASQVREALAACPFVVVSDCMADTDTMRYAQVRLPALAWGEKSGMVTNSERRISRQRAFLPAPGQARPDWWAVCEVARRMGFAAAFSYRTAADIFREHAALSGYENEGERDFDLSAAAQISDQDYEQWQPRQWPLNAAQPEGTARMFTRGRFFTPNGRARFIAVTPRSPVVETDESFPLILNTGRVRDQWHTMTRTGKAARLNEHEPEPFAQIHPQDAARYGNIMDGDLVRVFSRWGEILVRAHVDEQQRPGSVFVPFHWNDTNSLRAVVGSVINDAVDPLSGQPEFKQTPVRIEPYRAGWHGFVCRGGVCPGSTA